MEGMNGRKMVRGLLAAVLVAILAGPLAIGCSDEEAGADCSDPERSVEPASLEFNEECCSNEECGAGACASFNNKGQRCSKPCSGDADCAGLGEAKCGGQGFCAVPG